MHINDEAIIATSYIGRNGDENNRCFLSKESLFIKYKGRLESFPLSQITDIQFKHKLLLFPLISGGIISPLCLLALLKSMGDPWLLLSAMVAGLLMVYYGYEGSPSLSINSKIKEFDFFISRPTPNLYAFIKYVSQIYKYGEQGYYFYLGEIPDIYNGVYTFSEATHLLYYEEVKANKNSLYRIDPLKAGASFRFKKDKELIIPVLKGKIKEEFITPVDS